MVGAMIIHMVELLIRLESISACQKGTSPPIIKLSNQSLPTILNLPTIINLSRSPCGCIDVFGGQSKGKDTRVLTFSLFTSIHTNVVLG